MEWLKERYEVLHEVAGAKLALFGVFITGISGFIKTIIRKISDILHSRVGDVMLEGYDWKITIIVGLCFLFWWSLEAAVKVQRKSRPALKITYDPLLEGCIQKTRFNIANGGGDVIYFRLLIENTGGKVLNNCGAELVGMKKMDATSKFVSVGYGERTPLVWSGTDTQARKLSLQPRVSKFLDVICAQPPKKGPECQTMLEAVESVLLVGSRATLVTKGFESLKSVIDHHKFSDCGRYLLEISFSSDETLAITEKFIFNWTGDWETAEMSYVKG